MTDAPLLSSPPETPGPLWVRGRRRPGRSRWNYDPYETPDLAPARMPPRWAHPCERARRFWAEQLNLAERERIVPQLRKRRGQADRRWKRRDWTIWHHRFAVFLATHANVQTQEVGKWDGQKIKFWTLKQLAERIGCTFTEADARRSSEAPVRIERLIEDFEEAGLIHRRYDCGQLPDGSWKHFAAVLKVTLLFWAVSTAGPARETHIERLRRRKVRADAAAAVRDQSEAQYKADQEYRRRTQASWHHTQAEQRALAKRLADGKGWPPPPDGDPPPK